MTFFVTNLCRIFHDNRITAVYVKHIFHNNPFLLIIFSVMKVITLFFTATLRV